MQDAFDHPGRKRRKRSPTGAPPPLCGKISRWKVIPRTYTMTRTWNDLGAPSMTNDGKGGWG
ncbi:MAG: hypothetical protein HPY73_01910 [Methanomassiliicoccales archaeon]|nr:MAG: hypothetical protein HPY73_01910 [Methanomassiliicoccales archaeon]